MAPPTHDENNPLEHLISAAAYSSIRIEHTTVSDLAILTVYTGIVM